MTSSAAGHSAEKLPLWRVLTAVFILGGMVVVLLALAPVYLRNAQLQSYVRDLAQTSGAAGDDALGGRIMARAHDLKLPLEPGDVHVTREGDRLRIEIKYAVQKDFGLYQVDLHFHPGAVSR